ncbi:hypothetical protein DZC73_01715 [Albitalea terrae]|uniref:Uncharacterized protein n=2 Tax=Piscinibacter terrae TaxID=2496871 RepID=A0A3N7HU07_9BURK|nr:hypothetical protein DZC73_01715 [Albitalea terrae]
MTAAGCAQAPTAPRSTPIQHYSETISSVLISQDRRHLVVIGDHYHYVFDTPAHFAELLASPLHQKVSATLSEFHVSREGDITGRFTLDMDADLSLRDRDTAQALGFVQVDARHLVQYGEMRGRRFVGSALRADRQRSALNHPYTIEISAEEPVGSQVADRLSTPITVTSDGILLLYYVALSPVLLPMALMSRERKN